MDRRQELQEILKSILGSSNVYFQPPESVKLNYPCIIYNRDYIDQKYANNKTYFTKVKYSLLLITKTQDSELITRLLSLPYCKYDRYYAADSLHHDSFTIYY